MSDSLHLPPNRMTAYKVVLRKDEHTLVSAVVNFTTKSVVYHLDRLIEPKKGKLFVFSSLAQAVTFSKARYDGETYEVWEVTAYSPEPFDYRLEVDAVEKMCELFWHDKNSVFSSYINTTPVGTYVCSSLKMVRQIHPLDPAL
jgi:hypothetical protein